MFIKSLDTDYEVLQVIESTSKCDVYRCKVANVSIEKMLICIKDKNIMTTLIQNLITLENDMITFMNQSYLYLVFDYHTEVKFKDYQMNDFSLIERMTIGKSLLSYIMINKLPDFILYDGLSENNLQMDNSLSFKMNFHLRHVANNGVPSKHLANQSLQNIFSKLFEQEMVKGLHEDIDAFISILNGDATTFEVFKAYTAFSKVVMEHPNLLENQNKSKIKLALKWIFELKRFIKPVITIAVCLSAIIYMVYTTFIDPVYSNDIQYIHEIGTVRLMDD